MRDYGYKVVFGGADLAEAGFGVGQPFIFDSEPGYARLPNRFLIDRALGVWDPSERGTKQNLPPSRTSLKNYAYWLCNALEWAEARGVDLLTADYATILIGRYQAEMAAGTWSADKLTRLAGATINARVQIALEYQMWAADKGLRDPFTIPTVTRTYVAGSAHKSRSHEGKTVEVRKGKAKVNKRTLVFPSEQELKDWLNRVYARPLCGDTEGLIAELILNTGIRLNEAACFRVDTLAVDPSAWKIVNPDEPQEFHEVLLTLTYGTKGRHDGIDEHGDTIGPRGDISIPLWLAQRIHRYRQSTRLTALKPVLRKERTPTGQKAVLGRSVHLFIRPMDGKRYTREHIYEFWKKARGPEHWSPHLGRDWWACRYLEERMKSHAELVKQVLALPSIATDHPLVAALKDSAMTVIQIEIQPQLRHRDAKTTEIYLQWLFAKMRIPVNFTKRWVARDEEEVDEEHKNLGSAWAQP